MNTIEILEGMLKLLKKPGGWMQGSFSNGKYTYKGKKPSWSDPQATCFCLIGAGLNVTQAEMWKDTELWEKEIEKTLNGQSVPGFNDKRSTTHADVIRVLNQTIERLKKEQPPVVL